MFEDDSAGASCLSVWPGRAVTPALWSPPTGGPRQSSRTWSRGADRYRLLEAARALVASESGGRDEVYLSGSALAQAVLGEATGRDLARLIPAVVLVLSLMFLASFRHPAPALLSLAVIGVCLVRMAGLMGLTGHPVFVTTLVLPVVLVAAGISDDVYALSNYFNERAACAPP